MNKFIIFSLIMFVSTCSAQNNKIDHQKVIEVVLYDVSKINVNTSNLSKITGLEKKYFTTSLCFLSKYSKEKVCLAIDDKKFNYKYFEKKIYPYFVNRKVKLYLNVYNNNSRELLIIYKIE